jgi:hypothetical protein
MKAIDQMGGWKEPLALDMLTEFRKKYMPHIGHDNDSLHYFEQELNRVICAFVNEATKPWRDAYADSMMRTIPPAFTQYFESTDSELDRMRTMEGRCRSSGTAFGAALADIIGDQIKKAETE